MTFTATRILAPALAVASVIAMAVPAEAQWRGRTAAAAGIGFATGAVIGAAAANAAQPRYYGSPYYSDPYASYGYEPAPVYSYEPAPTYYYSYGSASQRPSGYGASMRAHSGIQNDSRQAP